MQLTFNDIVAARSRIADGLYATPCPESVALGEISACRVFTKLEYLQRTGSFKERGARNALQLLDPPARKRGVIAASAGNHALGLAYHGKLLNIPVTVVMPKGAPLVKVTTCRQMNATVILHGESFAEARAEAARLADHDSLTYIHGYDDPAIIAGQGTLALEVLEQVQHIDAIVVPIGGGGLIAGIGLAIKNANDRIRVIGVEAQAAAKYALTLQADQPVNVKPDTTLADGLATPNLGSNAFQIIRHVVDQVVTVDEDALALAVLRLIEQEKAVVEGAGAAGLAALLSGKLPELKGKNVVLPLTGGNIDPTILSIVIEKGLVADGRLSRFTVTISDRPGGLARLTNLIASTGASVMQITHDRAFCGGNVAIVNVQCIVETRDADHIRQLHHTLTQAGLKLAIQ